MKKYLKLLAQAYIPKNALKLLMLCSAIPNTSVHALIKKYIDSSKINGTGIKIFSSGDKRFTIGVIKKTKIHVLDIMKTNPNI